MGRGAIDGLLFLVGVLSILVIVWWEIRNDRTPPDGPTTGLLAMLPEKAVAAPTRSRASSAPRQGGL